jgi:hypothetical protein
MRGISFIFALNKNGFLAAEGWFYRGFLTISALVIEILAEFIFHNNPQFYPLLECFGRVLNLSSVSVRKPGGSCPSECWK